MFPSLNISVGLCWACLSVCVSRTGKPRPGRSSLDVPPVPSREEHHLPRPAGNTLPSTAQGSAGLPCCKGTLLAHGQLGVHQDLSCWAGSQLVSPSMYWWWDCSSPGAGFGIRWTSWGSCWAVSVQIPLTGGTSLWSVSCSFPFYTESQNHRIVGVGRDLCGSSSPTLICFFRGRRNQSRFHPTELRGWRVGGRILVPLRWTKCWCSCLHLCVGNTAMSLPARLGCLVELFPVVLTYVLG